MIIWITVYALAAVLAGAVAGYSKAVGKTGPVWVALAVALAGFAGIAAGVNEGVTATNDYHIAAAKQSIPIDVSLWMQNIHTTAPCKLELSYKGDDGKKILTLPGSDQALTAEMLKGACGK